MILQSICISNFRSIEEIELPIEIVNNSNTYTLLGINESGKSSFLKALSLIDESDINFPSDFHDESKEVAIGLKYTLEPSDIKELKETLATKHKFDKNLLAKINILSVYIKISYTPEVDSDRLIEEDIEFNESIFNKYTSVSEEVLLKEKNQDADDLDLNIFFSTTSLEEYFWVNTHSIVFWKSTPKYLILDEIDLQAFALDPGKISIPLANCFRLAGVKNISKEINKLNNPVAIRNMQSLLSDKITDHINRIWPEHRVTIQFQINNNKLTFLVEDKGVKYKAKTTGQRSDGFRQFVSFLLTVSAENLNEELSRSILLLDEPETHLHPTAQINLMEELIKITKSNNNNIVFFATHSNYMIDKNNIDRCYRISKKGNTSTIISRIQKINSSYAEVNYEIFEIITTDYHNELYGFLEDSNKLALEKLSKDRKWKNEKTGKTDNVSLSTYIRHAIHHPENTSNKNFTEKELKTSIEILRKLKYGKG